MSRSLPPTLSQWNVFSMHRFPSQRLVETVAAMCLHTVHVSVCWTGERWWPDTVHSLSRLPGPHQLPPCVPADRLQGTVRGQPADRERRWGQTHCMSWRCVDDLLGVWLVSWVYLGGIVLSPEKTPCCRQFRGMVGVWWQRKYTLSPPTTTRSMCWW